MQCIELLPADGRKSFYGKARAYYHANAWFLMSYDTVVAMYYPGSGLFIRKWAGYSQTTMRHINAFVRFLGGTSGGKAWWTSLPMNSGVPLV
jgi:hypothetical protein